MLPLGRAYCASYENAMLESLSQRAEMHCRIMHVHRGACSSQALLILFYTPSANKEAMKLAYHRLHLQQERSNNNGNDSHKRTCS